MLRSITSLQNAKIKNLVKLRQRRGRDQQKLMLIDGARAIRLALAKGFKVEALYFSETLADQEVELLAEAQAAGVSLYAVTAKVFQKIGYGQTAEGMVGLAPQPRFALADLPQPPQPLYLVVEGIEKPGNLGAILRSADAAGLTGLIICDARTDPYNPNVIRASRGAIFTVAVAWAAVDLVKQWLAQPDLQIFAATPARASQVYTQVDFRPPTALVLGAENAGLTQAWSTYPLIHIPMVGQVDSLNVAQTASILMFEARRQRAIS